MFITWIHLLQQSYLVTEIQYLNAFIDSIYQPWEQPAVEIFSQSISGIICLLKKKSEKKNSIPTIVTMLNFNKIIKTLFKYLKLLYFKFLFRASFYYTLDEQKTVQRNGQIMYSQLLYFFASQETNSKYHKHFLHKDTHLSYYKTDKNQRYLRSPTGE